MRILLYLLLLAVPAWAGPPLALPHPSGVQGNLAISPDSGLLASADDSANATLRIWDLRSKRMLRKWPGRGRVRALAISPDGSLLLECSLGDRLRAYSLPGGELLYEKSTGRPGAKFLNVEFSGDSRYLATWSPGLGGSEGFDPAVRVWDARTGQHLAVAWTDQGDIDEHNAAWRGAYLVHASNGTLQVWDSASQQIVQRYPLAENTDYALHPREPVVALFAPEGELRVHRLPDAAPLVSAPTPPGSHNLWFSPDGQKLFLHSDPRLVLDAGTLKPLLTWPRYHLGWVAPDRLYALGEGLLITPTGARLSAVNLGDLEFSVTPDGRYGLSATERLVTLPDGKPFSTSCQVSRIPDVRISRDPTVYPVRFTPDGSTLVLWRPKGFSLVDVTATYERSRAAGKPVEPVYR